MKPARHALAALLAAAACAAVPARAEPVHVERAGQAFGAGWLFLDAGDATCRLATPLHVARPEGEQIAATLTVMQADGRRIDAVSPLVPDDAYDVAFYEVRTGSKERPCTESRLGLENLAGVLAETDQAVLIRPAVNQTMKIPVRIATRDIDDDGGALFTIQLAQDAEVVQSMSGSTVMAGDVPLGMLTSVSRFEKNRGTALRFDVIRRLFRAGTKQTQPVTARTSSISEVTLRQGRVIGGAPISGLVEGSALHVQPERGAAELEIILAGKMPVAEVRVSLAGQSAGSVAISTAAVTAPASNAWTFAAPCSRAGDAVTCNVGRSVGALRIKILGPAAFAARGLEIR